MADTVDSGSTLASTTTTIPQGGAADMPRDVENYSDMNVTFITTGLGDTATRSGFLCLFIAIGFLGNGAVLITILHSGRLRRKVLNLFMIYLSVINLLECLVNLPVILGVSIAEEWQYGSAVCRLNAFTVMLTSQGLILGLLLMSYDRMLAVLNPMVYPNRVTLTRASVLVVCAVILAFALTTPVLTNAMSVCPFPARYLCSVGIGAPIVYVCLSSALGYILPLLAIMIAYCLVAKVAISSKLQQRNANPAQVYSNVGAQAEQQLWIEISAAKYVLFLFVLWCVFQGPYMLLNFVEEFRNSEGIFVSESALEFKYPWELSLSFTWMKLSYPLYLPIATFFGRKEVWQKFKNIILCRKSNLVIDASPQGSPASPRKTDTAKQQAENTLFKVPVLFATENGLHIQTYGKSPTQELTESQMYSTDTSRILTSTEIVTARKCDVAGSQLLQQGDQEDTSDYDSSEDTNQLSDSNTASINSDHKRRSNLSTSEPTVRTRRSLSGSRSEELPEIKHNAFDSGVDTIYNTNEKKKRKKNRTEVEKFRQNSSEDSPDRNENKDDEGKDKDVNDEKVDLRQRCRNSSDSGRGSPDGNNEKHRSPSQDPPGEVTSECQNIDETKFDGVAKAADTDSNKELHTKPRKKKKKREKRRNKLNKEGFPRVNTEHDDAIENREPEPVHRDVIITTTEVPNLAKKPPPRLKPIDHKTETVELGSFCGQKVLLPDVQTITADQRKRTESESSTKSDSKDCDILDVKSNPQARARRRKRTASESSRRTEPETPDVAHQRSSSEYQRRKTESDINERDVNGLRRKNKSFKTEAQNSQGPSPKPSPKPSPSPEPKKVHLKSGHQRRPTNDSQTALLGGSGSSVELGEIRNHQQVPSGEGDTEDVSGCSGGLQAVTCLH